MVRGRSLAASGWGKARPIIQTSSGVTQYLNPQIHILISMSLWIFIAAHCDPAMSAHPSAGFSEYALADHKLFWYGFFILIKDLASSIKRRKCIWCLRPNKERLCVENFQVSFCFYPTTNHPHFHLLCEMEKFIAVNLVRIMPTGEETGVGTL